MVNVTFQILFIISTQIVGCTRKSADKNEITTDVASEVMCYAYTENGDTIQLQMTTFNGSVKGELTYNLFEKDINRGTVVGSMQGDTLFVDYNFMSEGVESTREVAFVTVGENFIEAFGEVEELDDRAIFSDRQGLKLSEQIILKPIACDNF